MVCFEIIARCKMEINHTYSLQICLWLCDNRKSQQDTKTEEKQKSESRFIPSAAIAVFSLKGTQPDPVLAPLGRPCLQKHQGAKNLL